MKQTPYTGKKVNVFDVYQIYQILKFYYPDINKLPCDVISEIIEMEFGCKINENDVYLYLMLSNHWDIRGKFRTNE
jgi:hypothetical protein